MPFLQVQYPTGHKATIEIGLDKPLIKALEIACSRRSLDPFNYILIHDRRPLDLSASFRLSGLVNNAYVELTARSVDTPDCRFWATEIRLCFRLDEGDRVLWIGNPLASFWFILNEIAVTHPEIAKQIALSDDPSVGSLAVVYLREQVIGIDKLKFTRPVDLGIFQGSALVQLRVVSVPSVETPQVNSSHGKSALITRWRMELEAASAKSVSPVVQSTHLGGSMCTDSSLVPKQMDHALAPEVVSPLSGFAPRPPQSMFDQPEQPSTSVGIEKFSAEAADVNLLNYDFEGAGISTLSDSRTMDRQLVVFRRPSMISIDEASLDVPDDIFEPTEDDILSLLRTYRSVWQPDQFLLTSEMRKTSNLRIYEKYLRAVLQFHWPDGVILQACFDPKEKVSSLYEFIRECLRDPELEFQLFTTPPKTLLKDTTMTLVDAGLVPLANVYFSAQTRHEEGVLKTEVLSNATVENWSEAKRIVSSWMDSTTLASPDNLSLPGTSALNASTLKGPSVQDW